MVPVILTLESYGLNIFWFPIDRLVGLHFNIV